MPYRVIAFMFIAVLLVAFPVISKAQDSAAPKQEEQTEDDPARAKSKALQDKMTSLMRTLSQEEANHFIVMYTNYNVYSMVKAVENDVGNAIGGCGENNPGMKEDLEKRFEGWQKSVGSSLKEADANIKNLALAQTYLPQAEIQEFFAMIDEVRSYNSSRFETTPVTTPEACEFMLSKMDETEQSMQQLLQVALASYPNVLRKTQK